MTLGIVGAGLLGMTLALRLRRLGYQVTLHEASRNAGGLASPQRIGPYTWDRFYHVVLQSDLELRDLLAELQLADGVRWGTTRTGFYTGGRLHSLSNAIEFLRFPPLSLIDKARLGLTILHASRLTNWRALESIPATEWLQRWSGRRTFERIWLPLLKSKLGENYRIASAAFIWAIIARMYAARRAGLKREMFGYIEGGYEAVIARLRALLEREGVELVCGAPVAGVEDRSTGVHLRFADGQTGDYDRLILTIPTAGVRALCPQLTGEERARLDRVVYQGVACASLLLKKPLAGFYVTNITDSGLPFTAVIEMTALVDRARFGGRTLVYLPRYLTADDPYWTRSDEEIRADFVPALCRMHPHLSPDDVVAFQVARAREVLAIATLDYSARAMPAVRTSMPHVFVVNSAQIANGTLNVNETVGLANRKARELHEVWKTAPAPATESLAGA